MVRDDDVTAVAAVPGAVRARDDDRTSGSCVDWRSAPRTYIYAVPAVEALGDDCSRERIAEIAEQRLPAAAKQNVLLAATLSAATLRRRLSRELAAGHDDRGADRKSR